jgi:hypothetical protein
LVRHGVTLQELRVETFFPADEESEKAWKAMSVARPPEDVDAVSHRFSSFA